MSEQLKHKMQQWEAPPPPGCWEAIASRLDDAGTSLPARLYNLELAPPPASWNNIIVALKQTGRSKTPVRSFSRNLNRLAAAAIIIVLITGGWILLTQFVFQGDKRMPPTTATTRASSHLPIPPNAVAVNSTQDSKEDDPGTPGSYTGYSNAAHKPAADARPLRSASVSIQPAYREYPITVNYASMPDDNGALTRNLDPALTDNDYLVITGPNGEATKASVKLADALRYLYENTTDDNTDKTTNESKNWKKRLQEWRNKIISSHFIPASANFLDIVNLKDLIEETP